MLKRNNFYLLILVEISFLFFILIIIPSVFLIEKSGISQTSFENILPLDINHSYTQSFIADQDSLNSISVLIKNPALKSTDKVSIQLQNEKYQTLQSLDITGSGIQDPSWIRLKFLPIDSKKGDTFYIKVASNAKNDNDLYIYGNQETKNLNFKTTYKSTSLTNSLKDTLNSQKDKLLELNYPQSFLYLSLIVVINILIFLSL